jgi:hypothetical protein
VLGTEMVIECRGQFGELIYLTIIYIYIYGNCILVDLLITIKMNVRDLCLTKGT